MVRRVVIVLLTVGAVGTILLWFSSYFYVVAWRNNPNVQLPVCTIAFDAGMLVVSYHRYADDNRERFDATPTFLGVASVTQTSPAALSVSDDPAGLTIRRVQPLFALDGSLFYGDTRFVTLNNVTYSAVVIQLWLPFILLATYPTFAFIRGPLRRYHRRRKGLCAECGYNLTGLTEQRCPECATEFQVR